MRELLDSKGENPDEAQMRKLEDITLHAVSVFKFGRTKGERIALNREGKDYDPLEERWKNQLQKIKVSDVDRLMKIIHQASLTAINSSPVSS